jgi:hypothetical protein
MRGFILIVFGILYLMKPDLFRKGIWNKYSIHANKSPEEYRNYMKKLAIVLIIVGFALLAYDNRQLFDPKVGQTDRKTATLQKL